MLFALSGLNMNAMNKFHLDAAAILIPTSSSSANIFTTSSNKSILLP